MTNSSDLRTLVASSWEGTFGVEALGDDADFFELGGDSLAALEIASGLFEALGSPEGIEEDVIAHAALEHPIMADYTRYLEGLLRDGGHLADTAGSSEVESPAL